VDESKPGSEDGPNGSSTSSGDGESDSSASTEVATTAGGTGGPAESGWYPDPEDPGGSKLRFWDGTDWTDHVSAPETTSSAPVPAGSGSFRTERISDDERHQILSQQIQAAAVRGMRVETQDKFQAIMVEGQPVNHTLHAILTIFTCLIWGLVWAVIAATGGQKRHLITVDEYGNVTHQNLGKA
jgi:hypothetical protein